MKIGQIFGIKTTKHNTYYRCYFLWIPYMKIKYVYGLTKIYLFGIQIAHVQTICPAPVVQVKEVVINKENREAINQRAMEIISGRMNQDYMNGVK